MLKGLIHRSSEEDREAVEKIVRSIEDEENPRTTFLLLESALYFDNLGDVNRALQLARKGLEQAREGSDQNLLRKACNIVAWTFAKVCDFEQAFLHLEEALSLSVTLRSSVFHFAALCNAVPILQFAGLLTTAKNLALHLTCYESGTEELDYLHLQNSINGLSISRFTKDDASANRFLDIARAKLSTSGAVGKPWKAYVDAHHALFLLDSGRAHVAAEMIDSALTESAACANTRIDVTLRCAQAQCAIVLGNAAKLKESRRLVKELLPRGDAFAAHREHMLRTLVDLYATDRTSGGKRTGLEFLRKLNSHIVNTKHRQFFDNVSRRLEDDADGARIRRLTAPSYAVPKSIVYPRDHREKAEQGTSQLFVGEFDQVQEKALIFSNAAFRRVERSLRTSSFDVAEDWAVAADFASGRTGHHCFQVGRLAGLIASHLGLPDDRAVFIEMACRLHDIGKITLRDYEGHAISATKPEDFKLVNDHTLAGAKLLGSLGSPLFALAASVAKHHHEWWNGCGLPDALKGSAIPVEARICAVADAYVCLVCPRHNQERWSAENAVRQLSAMGGIQLDADLVKVCLEVVEENELGSRDLGVEFRWPVSGQRRLSDASYSLVTAINAGLSKIEQR